LEDVHRTDLEPHLAELAQHFLVASADGEAQRAVAYAEAAAQGNLIGTDASGTGALGNSSFGVNLGDAALIEGNLIAFNGGDGIEANCGACVQRITAND